MSHKIRTIIVDDEQTALDGVALLLSRDPEIDILALCSGGKEAIFKINEYEPDLLLLDIQMPELTGFEVLNMVTTPRIPVTVFITAYDQFALQAFEVNAVDYLLKPFSDQRFFTTMEKAKNQVKQMKSFEFQQKMLSLLATMNYTVQNPDNTPRNDYLSRIFIKDFKGISFLNVEDIRWIIADDYYVTIHTRERKYLLRETMNKLEAKLDPSKFIRISRSIIVCIDQIKSVEQYSSTENILSTVSGEKFKMSLARYRLMKDRFGL